MKRTFLLLLACILNMGAMAFWQWQLKPHVNRQPIPAFEQTNGSCDETPVPDPPVPPPPPPKP